MKYHPIYLIIIFARKLFMTSERKTGQKVILSCDEQFMSCCCAHKWSRSILMNKKIDLIGTWHCSFDFFDCVCGVCDVFIYKDASVWMNFYDLILSRSFCACLPLTKFISVCSFKRKYNSLLCWMWYISSFCCLFHIWDLCTNGIHRCGVVKIRSHYLHYWFLTKLYLWQFLYSLFGLILFISCLLLHFTNEMIIIYL